MVGCYITGALTVLFPDPSRLQNTNLNYFVNSHVTLRFIEPSLINKNPCCQTFAILFFAF